jgi:hypothetical protein
MVGGVERRRLAPGQIHGSRAESVASPRVRPELLRVKSDGKKLSFGAVAASYTYNDVLLRKAGDSQLLVGSNRGWVSLPAEPGEAVELFIRFTLEGNSAKNRTLETYQARIICPQSGAAKTLAEMGATFERYLKPL